MCTRMRGRVRGRFCSPVPAYLAEGLVEAVQAGDALHLPVR